MTLDTVVRSVKDTAVRSVKNFLIKEVCTYPGKKENAIGNGIRTAVGYLGVSYFDSHMLKAAFGAYMIVKGSQFIRDAVRYVW